LLKNGARKGGEFFWPNYGNFPELGMFYAWDFNDWTYYVLDIDRKKNLVTVI
jgi:hypothetical protein